MKKIIHIFGKQSDTSWLVLLNKYRLKADEHVNILRIEIDTPFIEPYQIVSLACLIEEYHLSGASIEFVRNNSLADEYLSYIRFFEYWTPGYDRNAFTESGKKTTLALWKISQERISTYADVSQKYFEDLHFPGKDLSALYIALTELFNNIYDHAQSSVEGFSITQYYPRLNQINTAVCDFGVGIPTTIKKLWKSKGKILEYDADALRASFVSRVSIQTTPQNRGFGLSNLLGNIQRVRGELIVYSNSAIVQFGGNSVQYRMLSNSIGGTLIKFSFNPYNLPEKGQEFDNEEFIF